VASSGLDGGRSGFIHALRVLGVELLVFEFGLMVMRRGFRSSYAGHVHTSASDGQISPADLVKATHPQGEKRLLADYVKNRANDFGNAMDVADRICRAAVGEGLLVVGESDNHRRVSGPW
jgi:hypothetical protein